MSNSSYVNYFSAPTFVWWDITNQCNLGCEHCYSNSSLTSQDVDQMSFDQIITIIDQMSESGVFYIYFLGGEPFIRPDFIEIIEYVRKKNIGVMVNTNGWFITKETARNITKLGVKQIRISLDGSNAGVHDSLRNKQGSFTRAVNSIKLMKQSKHEMVSVASTVTAYNIEDIEKLIDLAAELRVNDIQIVPLSNSGRGEDNYDKIAITNEQHLYLKEILEKKSKEYRGEMTVYSVDGTLDNQCTQCIQKNNIKPDFMGCRAGRTAVNIDFNGDVIPCLLVRKPVAGNLKEEKFTDIWNKSEVLQKWREKKNDKPECVVCEYNDICIRECPLSPSQTEITSEHRIKKIKNIVEKRNICSSVGCCSA